ncbi:hypothetical protein WN51_05944 [Melipona quadrifasciata]|uniref:Uncharacterized protein n=1 Tax=Melipona quadrifasciata TaxID=166423 RepID=A0A0M9A7I3_9HYME|nr:hypothetical protein WN51_05944 [Melipona quadrifasciata]
MATIAGLQLLGSSALTSYKVNFLPPIPTKENSLPSKEPASPREGEEEEETETEGRIKWKEGERARRIPKGEGMRKAPRDTKEKEQRTKKRRARTSRRKSRTNK